MQYIHHKFLQISIVVQILFSIFFITPSNATAQNTESFNTVMLEGRVVEVIKESVVTSDNESWPYQEILLLVTSGYLKGQKIVVTNGEIQISGTQMYKVGDELAVSEISSDDGTKQYFITDYVRNKGLLRLFVLFVVLVILVGGVWGVSSLFGMLFSFIVIFKFILPLILKGYDAVLVAIVGSILIIPVTFGLSHGLNRKTGIAVFGTIISLAITGLLATYFVNSIHLTGFASEESGFLQFELNNLINMKGLILAGIVIASLGVLDDITISQASIVEEIRRANPKLTKSDIFARSMKVGRDHIASLVNTLILVYAGASLPLLLLFVNNPHPFSEIVNYEIIADEIVRTLVGSMGLVIAVPITTFLAVYISKDDL